MPQYPAIIGIDFGFELDNISVAFHGAPQVDIFVIEPEHPPPSN
jgi:hypothetical protein